MMEKPCLFLGEVFCVSNVKEENGDDKNVKR